MRTAETSPLGVVQGEDGGVSGVVGYRFFVIGYSDCLRIAAAAVTNNQKPITKQPVVG